MRELNAAVLAEARTVTGRRGLRQKDISEWSTGPINQSEGETLFVLPNLGLNCAVLNSALGKKKEAK